MGKRGKERRLYLSNIGHEVVGDPLWVFSNVS